MSAGAGMLGEWLVNWLGGFARMACWRRAAFMTRGFDMATDDPEFAKLIDQIQAGSEEAVQTLVDEYGSYLYRAIRRRLNRQIRSQYDSQDFAQAVWASFFRHRETIARFRKPGELAAYLGTMAGNKV